ncbi:hypothetical protein BHE74_00002575 [Ensete ventricosum]|nr:hypothetical protein BHE74_00002575 [Ensete ventricosum]RZR81211.1 hypothetical protein BHM03_00007399 [Ensete ventricosum]
MRTVATWPIDSGGRARELARRSLAAKQQATPAKLDCRESLGPRDVDRRWIRQPPSLVRDSRVWTPEAGVPSFRRWWEEGDSRASGSTLLDFGVRWGREGRKERGRTERLGDWMLSVGRREDGRQGLGFGGGGMDEDNELEEGEACSGQEDDTCIDPDALSYIVRPPSRFESQ